MTYVDGYVIPVPEKNLAAYRRMAAKACKVWLEHGALDYRECVLDDSDANCMVTFPELVKPKRGETVVFSWIVFESKAHRNRVNKLAIADPRLKPMMDLKKLPFDCKRMVYGGFKVLVEKKK